MKKIFYSLFVAAVALSMVACKSAEKMAEMAENVIVKCNPDPMQVIGGKIDVDLNVTYPADYFDKDAILEVTPVIVYKGGEAKGDIKMYQGEKVENNYKVVPTAGGTVSEHFTFDYVEGMAQCTFELRGRCSTNEGKKWVDLPTKKAADGCIITETLVCTKGCTADKANDYQAVIISNPEGQVLYKINSADVRSSEIKGESVKAFKDAVKEANENERKQVKSIDVVAYASPDGPEAKNITLSENRSKSADKAFKNATKKDNNFKGIATEVKSVGEDWEGFQELVGNSNIEDKDLIVRVLGMYNDPAVREKEIKNMSSVYQELAKDVLPQLRRARFIANVEFTNYSDEELLQLVKDNIDVLDEEALLKAAEVCQDNNDRINILKKAVEKYNSERAQYNLACAYLKADKIADAKTAIEACNAADADVKNVKGVIALRNGDWSAAKDCFIESGSEAAQKNLGACDIKAGKYADAAAKCGDKGCNAALAQLLNGNVDAALACLGDCQCPKTNYIRAICLTRQGKVAEAKEALKKATDADKDLAKRAETDIEFATLK